MGLNMPSPKTDLTADALSDRQRAAESVARYGGLLALALRADPRGLEIALKGPQDVVTMADGEVERSIIAALGAAFPHDAFLGEESGGTPRDPGWGIRVPGPLLGSRPPQNVLTYKSIPSSCRPA